jgi:hypothetical protein
MGPAPLLSSIIRPWRDCAREAHRRLQAPWRTIKIAGRLEGAAGALGAAEGGRAADGLTAHGAGRALSSSAVYKLDDDVTHQATRRQLP